MIVDGNNFIRHHLKNNILFTAGKIGVTEIKILYSYFYNNKTPEKNSFYEGYIQSGIYPLTIETYNYFCETYIDAIKSLDLAPRWCKCLSIFEEELYNKLSPKCYNTNICDLEPFHFEKPWTDFLQDKKVLVVTPFSDSIKKQFNCFEEIWNKKLKKNFELITLGFPFSRGLCDKDSEYKSYMDCLEKTKEKIQNLKFDFAIFGVGAYSLPLCSFVKKLGISSLHLGGATQILFGIKGRRWEEMNRMQPFFNKFWINPSAEERPTKLNLMEEGCYW
jgi:hypothetical protein